MPTRRKIWGWGLEGEGYPAAQVRELGETLGRRFGRAVRQRVPAAIEDVGLRPPRVKAPASLESMLTDDHYERVIHSYGKSNRDL